MRLTPYERETIRKVADEVFGDCEVSYKTRNGVCKIERG